MLRWRRAADGVASLTEGGEGALHGTCAPLNGQQEVDAEAVRWFSEWLELRDYDNEREV